MYELSYLLKYSYYCYQRIFLIKTFSGKLSEIWSWFAPVLVAGWFVRWNVKLWGGMSSLNLTTWQPVNFPCWRLYHTGSRGHLLEFISLDVSVPIRYPCEYLPLLGLLSYISLSDIVCVNIRFLEKCVINFGVFYQHHPRLNEIFWKC